MKRSISFFAGLILILFLLSGPVAAATVAISGTVTKTGGGPLQGVVITLAKKSGLSAFTDASGKFTLSSVQTLRMPSPRILAPEFALKGKTLTIVPVSGAVHYAVEVFSGNGRKIASIAFANLQSGKQSLVLPEFGPGMSILRIALNGTIYTFPVLRMGNALYFMNQADDVTANGKSMLAKAISAPAIDTLVARKLGFTDNKTPVASYSLSNVAVAMDSSGIVGNYPIPAGAGLEDITHPDYVIGKGTPESCSPDSFIKAVGKGGVIVFNCGSQPSTIMLNRPAKVFNDGKQDVVIDGAGLVTLSGGGTTRIIYMNTCDSVQHWTTPRCDNQAGPRLTLQNLTFIGGNSKNETENDGGGAVFAQGGRLKIVNCRFYNNVCVDSGPDVGGAAVRAFEQYQGLPVYVVGCTFGGAEGRGNTGANGGGLSSIGVSWTVVNCLFSYNRAVGRGGNPAQTGTPGGGSGGAIYNDGNTMTLTVLGTLMEHNSVNAFGSAIFFVSNDHTGNIVIDGSIIRNNMGGSWYAKPGISMHEDTPLSITNSTIE
jgi:hypothetical protein